MNEILSLIYSYARAVWRRRWWAVISAWAVALVAWAVVLMMPDRYEASARVFVDTRTALRPVLEGIAIEDNYESQLALVREALLSRPQLEAVARRTNLDAGVTTPAAMEALISSLQGEIQIGSAAPVAAANGGQSRDMIYTITYQNTNREKSVDVVRTLLDNLREGTLTGNRTGATEAQDFLDQQIADLEKRLQEAEGRLAEFKKRNIGMLPNEQRGDYFARLDQEMAGLQQSETALAVALSRQAELKRQLESTRPYLPGTGGGGGATPDVSLRRQEAEQRLEALLLRFTERNPEVIAQRAAVEELKAREARELAVLEGGGTGTGAISSLNPNPVYQQIQSQLGQVKVEIASHQGAAAQHRREIANLRRFVDQAPEVAQEYARLNRDYGVLKDQYDQLVGRREQARVTDDAARTGIVRFDTIEPPRADSNPVAPKRQLLFIACLFLAIGAGIGIALLPQLLSPTIDDIPALERRFDLPVLGAVSALRTPDELASGRREFRLMGVAIAVLLALAGILVVAGGAGARALQQLLA